MVRCLFPLMTQSERRRYPRRECELTVQVRFSGQTEPLEATVADICLGGCYISTVSPPPAGTTVLLCFNGAGEGATVAGRTVTCMPGSGMGIEFTGAVDADSDERLQALIERLNGGGAKTARLVI
jgi:PilZ domain